MNRNCKQIRVTRQFFLASIFISLFTTFLYAGEYAGEKLVAAYYSDRYHVASCKIAKKIHPDDLVVYKSPEEAVEAGLVPCKKCNPPVPKDKTNAQKFNFGSKKKNADDPTT